MGFFFTDNARAFAQQIAGFGTQVSPVLSTIQSGGTTPSSTDVSNAISVLSQIGTALQQFVAANGTNPAFSGQTNAMATDLPVVQKVFYDQQQSLAAHPSGFVGPLDPTEVQNAATAWTDLLSQAGSITGVANSLDANLAQSQASNSGGSGPSGESSSGSSGSGPLPPAVVSPSSSSSSGSTIVTTPLPPTDAGTPPSSTPPPAATSTSSSILPTVTPAAAVAIGVGGILVLGVVVSALRGGAVLLNPRPPRRGRRRNRRRRSRR